MLSTSRRAEEAARLLARLADTGETIPDLPEEMRPATLAEGYAIQDAALAGRPPYGWKVGTADTPDGLCAAPLRGAGPHPAPHALAGPLAAGMAVEVEVTLTLAAGLPGDASPTQVADAVGGVHLAYELFRSSYVDRRRVAFPSLLADHLSNAGIVLGERQPFDPDRRLDTLAIELLRDGEQIGNATSGPALATVLDQLTWLSRHAAARGVPLRAGTVVLTGARIGPLPVTPGSRLEARAAIGSVTLVTPRRAADA